MARVYSAPLIVQHGGPTVTVVVPVGERWVVRTVSVFYPGASVVPGVNLVDNASGATIFWDSAEISAAGLWRYWNDLRLVLLEDGSYTVNATGGPDYSFYGYILTLP